MLRCEKIKNNSNFSVPLLVNSDTVLREDGKFHVDVKALEALLDSFFGCKLSDIPLGGGEKQFDVCSSVLPRYSNYGFFGGFLPSLSKKFFGENLKPSAMFYKNVAELLKNVFLMYQFSYAHYVIGKHKKMRDTFPSDCCAISSANLLIAFWEAGIISAVMVSNRSYGHAYLIIPFIIQESDVRGVIVVDPTSDQLMNDCSQKIRNRIMIMTEEKWSYKTDSGDLYPDKVDISACYGDDDKDYGEYLKEAFKNPVVVV